MAFQGGREMSRDDKLQVRIRWLIRQDMVDVLRIENLCFDFPWCDDDFRCYLRRRNCIGMVAEANGIDGWRIVDFMIYELNKGWLSVLNFAVDPQFRRRGVGTQMVERLVDKLGQQRRTDITALVRECNLDGQLFFRGCGFKVTEIVPDAYDEHVSEDGYLFRYHLDLPNAVNPFSNRPLT